MACFIVVFCLKQNASVEQASTLADVAELGAGPNWCSNDLLFVFFGGKTTIYKNIPAAMAHPIYQLLLSRALWASYWETSRI